MSYAKQHLAEAVEIIEKMDVDAIEKMEEIRNENSRITTGFNPPSLGRQKERRSRRRCAVDADHRSSASGTSAPPWH